MGIPLDEMYDIKYSNTKYIVHLLTAPLDGSGTAPLNYEVIHKDYNTVEHRSSCLADAIQWADIFDTYLSSKDANESTADILRLFTSEPSKH